jgi:hypothetical protein
MGHPTSDYETGNDCMVGVNASPQLWPLGGTPKIVYASFAGIGACGPAFDCPEPEDSFTQGNFTLEQQAGPCTWRNMGGGLDCYFTLEKNIDVEAKLSVSVPAGWLYFQSIITNPSKAYINFPNQLGCSLGTFCGTGGNGTVCWSGKVKDLLVTKGLYTAHKPLFELFCVDSTKQLIRCAEIKSSMNIKILLET